MGLFSLQFPQPTLLFVGYRVESKKYLSMTLGQMRALAKPPEPQVKSKFLFISKIENYSIFP